MAILLTNLFADASSKLFAHWLDCDLACLSYGASAN